MPTIPTKQSNAPKLASRPKPVPRAFPIAANTKHTTGERVVYIGKPLTGKTKRLLTWPGLVVIQWEDESTTLEQSGIECPVITIPDWPTWEQLVLPKLRNRSLLQQLVNEMPGFESYKIETIGFDSYTSMDIKCESFLRETGGFRDTRQMYGEKLQALYKTQRVLMDLTKPTASLPGWHFVATVHEHVETSIVDNKEVIEDIRASVSGKFGKNFAKDWGLILWCFVDVPTAQDGTILRGKKPVYYCRTDVIDAWRKAVDRTGRLPSRVEGSYPDIKQYWSKKSGSEA